MINLKYFIKIVLNFSLAFALCAYGQEVPTYKIYIKPPPSTPSKSQSTSNSNEKFSGINAVNKYINISELDTQSNVGKAILVFSRIGNRNQGRKIKVSVGGLTFELGIDQVKKLAVYPGRYSIVVDNSGLIMHRGNSATETFVMAANMIHDIKIGFPYFQQESLPEIWFRRISFDGKLINKNPLSEQQDVNFIPSKNTQNAKRILQNILAETQVVVDRHKRQERYSNIEELIEKDISKNEMKVQLSKSKNGKCLVRVFKAILQQKDYLDFFESISEVHKYECLNVLVDITNRGGDGETGARMGIYINMNKWSTTIGGMSVSDEDRVCLSSCTLVYLGGINRYTKRGIPLYLHQPMNVGGKCVMEESVWAEFSHEYFAYLLGENGDRLFSEFMTVPCQKQLEPSDKTMKLFVTDFSSAQNWINE